MKLINYGTAVATLMLLPVSVMAQQAEDDDRAMLELATKSGCFICHAIAQDPEVAVPLAPAYQQVAARYQGQDVQDEMVDRVLHGTVYKDQNWEGAVNMRFMPPNVNLTKDEAEQLVSWILTMEGAPSELQLHEDALVLATNSGCMTCHEMSPLKGVKAIPLAPSLREVAAYYDGKADARDHLLDSVRNGTVGKPKIWESVNMRFMPPNVNLRQEDVETLVDWILSLEHEGIVPHPEGTVMPTKG